MTYPQNMMVKQWVGEVRLPGRAYWVFTTGDSRYYLFVCITGFQKGIPGSGWSTGVMIPVRKTELKRGVVTKHGCLWRE